MLLLALVLAQQAGVQPPADSVYASPALRAAVEIAAQANKRAPAALKAYRAHLESEIALILVDTLGRERTGQLEQVGGTATWSVATGYDAHVEGYRSTIGAIMSMFGFLRSWTLPMLYGERLVIGIEGMADTGRTRRQPPPPGDLMRDLFLAVHPFAADRDGFYKFSGGDTIAVLTTANRRIPVMRIRAIPNLDLGTRFAAFDGEIDIDATRGDIIRMRGKFVVSRDAQRGYSTMTRLMIKATGTVAVAFAEYVNGEYDGKYWLPTTQRLEFQATIALMGGPRSVFRIVSHFSDFAIDDTSSTAGTTAAYTRRRVTYAPTDTMSAFSDWRSDIGAASAAVRANDFEDVAPPQWKGDGSPRLTLFPSRPDRVIHYDRIEGLYTGAEVSLEARGLAPGVVARGYGGWAWSEKTIRGGFSLNSSKKNSLTALRLDRQLASTADFTMDFQDQGTSIGAFFASIEEIDYVDRWTAGASHTHAIGSLDHALIVGRLAAVRDVDVQASILNGPVSTSTKFLPNRHATTGTYGYASLGYEFHPNISGEGLAPGIGTTTYVEAAAGALSWLRVESSVSVRKYLGPLMLFVRGDAGAVFARTIPPQALFELGGGYSGYGRLIGYAYKEFAGDRAALFSSYASYGFPIFRAPHRVKWFLLPGLTPGIGAGFHGGWTDLTTAAAQRAVLALGDGTAANAVSRATGRARMTGGFGLTFISGLVHVGLARPLDHPAPWKWVIGAGPVF